MDFASGTRYSRPSRVFKDPPTRPAYQEPKDISIQPSRETIDGLPELEDATAPRVPLNSKTRVDLTQRASTRHSSGSQNGTPPIHSDRARRAPQETEEHSFSNAVKMSTAAALQQSTKLRYVYEPRR